MKGKERKKRIEESLKKSKKNRKQQDKLLITGFLILFLFILSVVGKSSVYLMFINFFSGICYLVLMIKMTDPKKIIEIFKLK